MKLGKETFIVHIDESGCEGFSFSRGSSKWFVIAALVTPRCLDAGTVQLVKTFKVSCKLAAKKPLHFRDLKHDNRVELLTEMAKARNLMRSIVIAVHKPSLADPEVFKEKNRLYFYASRYLLERASWLCRDTQTFLDRSRGDGTAHVVFSKRKGMKYEDFKTYVGRLETQETEIKWGVIRPSQVSAQTNGKRAGLQLADAVASAFGFALQPSRKLRDHAKCYVDLVKPLMYSSPFGRRTGYGLKIFPKEAWNVVRSDAHLDWARNY